MLPAKKALGHENRHCSQEPAARGSAEPATINVPSDGFYDGCNQAPDSNTFHESRCAALGARSRALGGRTNDLRREGGAEGAKSNTDMGCRVHAEFTETAMRGGIGCMNVNRGAS